MRHRHTVLLALLLPAIGLGQDAHFTQMLHSGSLLNPALTGSFEQKADFRASVQYRQQWASLTPAYRDFMASVEKSGRAWQFGGLAYGHDAGGASLRTTGVRASAALQKQLGPGHSALSLGLSLGVEQQRFDPSALAFSSQYDTDKGYSADLPNGENFARTGRVRPDLSVGLGWRAGFFSEKISPAAGISLAHVAQPMFSAFPDGGYALPMAVNWFARLGLRIDGNLSITPFVWRLRQAGFSNKVYGADLAIRMPAATVHLAGGKRTGDAVLLKIGLDRGRNTVGLSYDVNTSKLRRATSGQGAWELAVSHYFNKKGAKPIDTDHDGVPDKTDDCPLVMAKTACGCPSAAPAAVLDSDGDGVVDAKDRCPDEPGLIRLHGCPDTDGDGITDNEDQCPNLPGSLANNGCPLLPKDADDDGILDVDDHCPYIKGLAQFHGCPDTDGDGQPDLSDRCPFLRGPLANMGCPENGESPEARVGTARERSPIPSVLVEFDHDRAEVKPQFFTQLDQMAAWLYNHPKARLMLAGHTDAEGDGAYNFRLGLRRAQAVEEYFVARRISPDRFEMISYGETMPKSGNETTTGKARNRRTEAIVVEER